MKTKNLSLSFAFVIFSLGFIYVQNDYPHVSVSGKTSGNISLGEVIGQQLIPDKSTYNVESFSIVVGSGDSVFTIDVEGSFVDKKASNRMRTLPSGTSLVFKNITLVSNGKVYTAPELKFTLI